ncbi:hypothetical protein J4457_01875 [Candidatus Woesearchaeota archaeon]|nr:hypothetical protein [Candidatus Woesearchaeota archaeon]
MKKIFLILFLTAFLTACGEAEIFCKDEYMAEFEAQYHDWIGDRVNPKFESLGVEMGSAGLRRIELEIDRLQKQWSKAYDKKKELEKEPPSPEIDAEIDKLSDQMTELIDKENELYEKKKEFAKELEKALVREGHHKFYVLEGCANRLVEKFGMPFDLAMEICSACNKKYLTPERTQSRLTLEDVRRDSLREPKQGSLLKQLSNRSSLTGYDDTPLEKPKRVERFTDKPPQVKNDCPQCNGIARTLQGALNTVSNIRKKLFDIESEAMNEQKWVGMLELRIQLAEERLAALEDAETFAAIGDEKLTLAEVLVKREMMDAEWDKWRDGEQTAEETEQNWGDIENDPERVKEAVKKAKKRTEQMKEEAEELLEEARAKLEELKEEDLKIKRELEEAKKEAGRIIPMLEDCQKLCFERMIQDYVDVEDDIEEQPPEEGTYDATPEEDNRCIQICGADRYYSTNSLNTCSDITSTFTAIPNKQICWDYLVARGWGDGCCCQDIVIRPSSNCNPLKFIGWNSAGYAVEEGAHAVYPY